MTNTYKCPKCDYSSDTAFEECPKCGVIIKKFIGAQKRQEKQKKIEELEKKIKRTKSGWFKKQKSKKVAIIACTFALILFCGYGIKSYLLVSEKDYLKRGNSKFENADENTAIKENDYAKLGMQYFEWRQYKKSKEYFTKAIESDPKNYSLWLNRGVCWNQLGKFDEALQDYQYARMLKPNYPLIEKNIRITLRNKTKYNEYNLKKIQKNAIENLQRELNQQRVKESCSSCNGTGKVEGWRWGKEFVMHDSYGNPIYKQVQIPTPKTCPVCNGTGRRY